MWPIGEDGKMQMPDGEKEPDEGREKEFVSGVWLNKGSVCFVLEMLVTDEVTKTVQHMLHQIEEFGNKHERCYETDAPIKDWLGRSKKVICYECGRAYSKDVTNYQARMEEYGYEVGREYILDIVMREEEHWLDSVFKTINVTDKVDQAVNHFTKSIAGLRVEKKPVEEEVPEDPEKRELFLKEKKEQEKERKLQEKKAQEAQQENDAKQAAKEKALQDAYELKMEAIRKEVEDHHFSRPICQKCSTARVKLTHPSTPVYYANEPPIQGKLECVDSLNLWECPDQNAVCGTNYTIVRPENVRIEVGASARWNEGLVKDRPDDDSGEAWDGNFRYNWKEVLKTLEEKYEDMDGEKYCRPGHPGGAMKKTTIVDTRMVLHAKDPWIFKLLPKNQKKKVHPNESDEDLRLRVASESPARNAMTLVRGSFYVEPLELTRQCPGRVNKDGIRPEEDEDVPRDAFCDVRFDVANPPAHRYCLWDGKVYCKYCAAEQYKVPLPEFEEFPDQAEPRQVSYQAKYYRQKTPIGRIQPVSEKPPEEPKVKKATVIEEEEPEEDAPNPVVEMLRTVPLCGKDIANKLEEMLEAE